MGGNSSLLPFDNIICTGTSKKLTFAEYSLMQSKRRNLYHFWVFNYQNLTMVGCEIGSSVYWKWEWSLLWFTMPLFHENYCLHDHFCTFAIFYRYRLISSAIIIIHGLPRKLPSGNQFLSEIVQLQLWLNAHGLSSRGRWVGVFVNFKETYSIHSHHKFLINTDCSYYCGALNRQMSFNNQTHY